MLVKIIRPKKCVKDDPALPVDTQFYGARQNQQCEEKLPEETTMALKSGRTRVCRSYSLKVKTSENVGIFALLAIK
jgi:hypothetical protein